MFKEYFRVNVFIENNRYKVKVAPCNSLITIIIKTLCINHLLYKEYKINYYTALKVNNSNK